VEIHQYQLLEIFERRDVELEDALDVAIDLAGLKILAGFACGSDV
jgi:hypothetical protein